MISSGNSAIERLEKFLEERGLFKKIVQLTPDASTREYFRISWKNNSAIACVYPLDEAGAMQFEACLDVTALFLSADLPVAKIFFSDSEKKIIIHEDFGDTILHDKFLKSDRVEYRRLLDEAICLIAKIQAATGRAFQMNSIASRLKFDKEKLLWELQFFKTHYFGSLLKKSLSVDEDEKLTSEFFEICRELEKRAKYLTHRDFHTANLMYHDGKIKIIDHQDARIGTASYDLVSLLLDRITEKPSAEFLSEKRKFFLKQREASGLEKIDEEDFAYEFQLQTIQRCLKAIGTFSYQSVFRNKKGYIRFVKPMSLVVLDACEALGKFFSLRELIREDLA
jgi:aminoglycoside/choline kinase family phosphotransferase